VSAKLDELIDPVSYLGGKLCRHLGMLVHMNADHLRNEMSRDNRCGDGRDQSFSLSIGWHTSVEHGY